jgi:hypothetical protein
MDELEAFVAKFSIGSRNVVWTNENDNTVLLEKFAVLEGLRKGCG